MLFGYYDFIKLTDAEHARRGQTLAWYGQFAQLSVLAPLAVLQLYFLAVWLSSTSLFRSAAALLRKAIGDDDGTDDGVPPKSPVRRRHRAPRPQAQAQARSHSRFRTYVAVMLLKVAGWLNLVQRWWRAVGWWMGDPVWPGWETRGQWAVGLGWGVWLFVLCFAQTGKDYLHLTKRVGIVGVSQLPLHYLLVMRSPYSPLQLLTRQSHDQLKVYHQLLGKIIVGLFGLHGTLYLAFFAQYNLLGKRLRSSDVIIGITSLTLMGIVNSTALAAFRKWNYRVFYTIHVVLSTCTMMLVFFHVRYLRVYIYELFGVYAVHQVLRAVTTRTLEGSVEGVEGTNLVHIRLPTDEKHLQWKTGQHVYLGGGGTKAKPTVVEAILQSHRGNPFTIASVPGRTQHLQLVARTLKGNTRKLMPPMTDAVDRGDKRQVFLVEGPYGQVPSPDILTTYDRVLLVAGGVGATFIWPYYQTLAEKADKRSVQPKVRFIWAVRSLDDTKWASLPKGGDNAGFTTELYLTQGARSTATAGIQDNDGDEMELRETATLLEPGKDDEVGQRLGNVEVELGRPDLRAVAKSTFGSLADQKLKVAVLVCGPAQLVQSLRREVGRYALDGRDVFWHAEKFDW